MISTLLGQDYVIISQQSILDIYPEENKAIIQYLDVKIPKNESEETIDFLENLADTLTIDGNDAFRIEQVNFSSRGKKMNIAVVITILDDPEFLKALNLYQDPDGKVFFHPYEHEVVKKTNGEKGMLGEVEVYQWDANSVLKIKTHLDNSEELDDMLEQYYGELIPVKFD